MDESLEGEALVADYFAFIEEHSGTARRLWERAPNRSARRRHDARPFFDALSVG